MKRQSFNIKKVLVASIGGIVIFSLLLIYGLTRVYPYTIQTNSYMDVAYLPSAKILDMEQGNLYQQTLVAPRDEIAGFNIRFGNFGTVVNGKLQILCELDDKIIYDEMLSCQEIVDNEFRFFPLRSPVIDGAGKKITISIRVLELTENQKLALFMNDNDEYKDGEFLENGKVLPKIDIACQLSGTSGFMLKWYVMGCAFIMLCYCILCYFGYHKNRKIEYIYLCLALTFGCVFILCFPPYTAPDEERHIASTYAFVNDFLGNDPILDDNGRVLIRDTDHEVGHGAIVNKIRFAQVYHAYAYPGHGLERSEGYSNLLNVPFLIYLPQIVGVMIGILFNLTGFWTMYLGKIFAMLCFSLLLFISIKIIPWGKMVIVAIGLLPMTLELATSYSYDSMIIALSILFVSYVMLLIYKKEKVTWQDILLLSIIISIIAPCKMFYFLIAGMMFLIPVEKYSSKRMYWIVNASMIILAVMVFLSFQLQFVLGHVGESPNGYAAGEVNYSVAAILGDIPHSILVLFNTLMDRLEWYIQTLIGSSLGWFQVGIPTHIVTGFSIVLFVSAFLSNENEVELYYPNKCFRFTLWGLGALMIMGILAALWIGWTPSTYDRIEGVQGRYFLPLLIVMLLPLRNRAIVFKKNFDIWIGMGLFILLLFAYFYIVGYALV